jgi:hypothetical protein
MSGCRTFNEIPIQGPRGFTGATGPSGGPTGATGATGATGPGVWYENFTFGLTIPTWSKEFKPSQFTSATETYWLAPGMNDVLMGTGPTLGQVTPTGPLSLTGRWQMPNTINNYEAGNGSVGSSINNTPRSIAICYDNLTCSQICVHLTEIGVLNGTGGGQGAVNGWSQTVLLRIHSFCDINRDGYPIGTSSVTTDVQLPGAGEFTVGGPGGVCRCISIGELNIGCDTDNRQRFLAVELIPIPNAPPTNPSFPLPLPATAYTIKSRTISVTVKGSSTKNPP